jgi:hypothetical protein
MEYALFKEYRESNFVLVMGKVLRLDVADEVPNPDGGMCGISWACLFRPFHRLSGGKSRYGVAEGKPVDRRRDRGHRGNGRLLRMREADHAHQAGTVRRWRDLPGLHQSVNSVDDTSLLLITVKWGINQFAGSGSFGIF